jgi:endo-1,4-beta-xylanase
VAFAAVRNILPTLMRLPRLLLFVLIAVASLQFSSARAGELLSNPEFAASADGRLADGWRDGSTALPQPAVCTIVTDPAGGRRLQQVTLGPLQGGRCRLMQMIASLAGGLYRLKLKCRAQAPVQLELALRTTAKPWTSFGSVRESLPAETWHEVTGYARLPAGRTSGDFVILVDDPGVVALASASLEAVDEASLSPAERLRVERVLGPPLPPADEAQVIAGIDGRIQANRTAPITVDVVDPAGRPVAGATVNVEHLQHRFWFGAGFDWGLLHSDKTQADLYHREAFLRLFNSATVQLYAADYEPKPGAYLDEESMRALAWLNEHGLRASGNSLYWNLAAPRWLGKTAMSVTALEQWMDGLLKHASQGIFPRMAGVEVFNEVVAWERFQTPLTPVLAGGRKVAVIADFTRRFKALNPRAAAMVNDYDSTPEYYNLLKDIVAEGGSLDAIGLQSHMHNGTWSVAQLWNVLNRLALLNRPVFFTELSVVSGAPRDFNFRPADPAWGTTPEGETAQADYLELFYRLVYSHRAVGGVTYWDYSDRSAWLGCPVGLLRKDGSPKPAYWRLDRLINQEWRTRGTYLADAGGRLVVPHAFEGDYRISVEGIELRREHSVDRPMTAMIVVGK